MCILATGTTAATSLTTASAFEDPPGLGSRGHVHNMGQHPLLPTGILCTSRSSMIHGFYSMDSLCTWGGQRSDLRVATDGLLGTSFKARQASEEVGSYNFMSLLDIHWKYIHKEHLFVANNILAPSKEPLEPNCKVLEENLSV